jgi:hypothetical protein
MVVTLRGWEDIRLGIWVETGGFILAVSHVEYGGIPMHC